MKHLLIIGYSSLLFLMGACVSNQNSVVLNNTDNKKNKIYNNGYFETSEKERTGAIQSVEAAAIVEPLDQYLRKVSGVIVSGSGKNANITVRGLTSLNGSNEPLFLVDNIVINGGYAAVLEYVSSNEIASVTVLKDASETGVYGTRGSNGVILIDRKKRD
jgi:TonB-dependent starch-binding outer membrane protein SusC